MPTAKPEPEFYETATEGGQPAPKPAAPPQPSAAASKTVIRGQQSPDFSGLPGYSRSLLKISVPVSVELASKKETLQEVIGLAPLEVDWAFDQPLGEAASEILVEDSGAEGDITGATS